MFLVGKAPRTHLHVLLWPFKSLIEMFYEPVFVSTVSKNSIMCKSIKWNETRMKLF